MKNEKITPQFPELSLARWLYVLALVLFDYFLFNTSNPISQALFVSIDIFMDAPTKIGRTMLIQQEVLQLIILVVGLLIIMGWKNIRQYFHWLKWWQWFMIIPVAVLGMLMMMGGRELSNIFSHWNIFSVPPTFNIDQAQLISKPLFNVMNWMVLYSTISAQIVAILVLNVVFQFSGIKDYSFKNYRVWLFALLAALIGGFFMINPANPNIFYSILGFGGSQFIFNLAYIKMRNPLIPMVSAYGVDRLFYYWIMVIIFGK